jgi:uncharacterized protein (TIGR02284 family)
VLVISTDADLLRSLTATLLDSANGFRRAARTARSESLSRFLDESADERDRLVDILQQATRQLGEDAEEQQSLAGEAHQAWLGVRMSIDEGDEEAILDEVVFGEEYLQQKFEEPLRDDTIGAVARAAIQQVYEPVCARYRQVLQARLSLKGEPA